MPPPFSMQSDSTAILHWYALIEQVYQHLDAVIAAGGAPGSAPSWDALLQAASEHFGLEQLSLQQGPAPARNTARVVHVPLSPAPRWSGRPSHDPAAPRAGEPWHLMARLSSKSATSPRWHAQLSQFAEHLEHCRGLQHRMHAEHERLDRLRRCLDAQPTAAVLCDARGQAVRVNRAASELAQRVPELHLGPGVVRFLSSTGEDTLSALFERVRQGPLAPPACRWEASADGLHFTLLALAWHGAHGAAATGQGLGLVIQERGRCVGEAGETRPLPPPPTQFRRRLREHFGLTEKEIQLAHALGMGLSIGAYAERCGRSPQTLRTQVKSIFAKLEVHDQKSLILRVWQERQADWVECVSLLLGEPLAETRLRGAPTLRPLRPPAPTVADPPGAERGEGR